MISRSMLKAALLWGVLIATSSLAAVPSAQASIGPKWRIDSTTNTTAAPGSELTFEVQLSDAGDESIPPSPGGNAENCVSGAPAPADPAKCITLTGSFPPGLRPLKGSMQGWGSCAAPVGATLTCSVPGTFAVNVFGWWTANAYFTVRVGKEAAGTLTSSFEVSGGEAGSAVTVDPTSITEAPPSFRLDGFDSLAATDTSGSPLATAGGHPYSLTTWLDYATHTETPSTIFGLGYPVEPVRDTLVDLPPGLIGNPAIGKRCTAAELRGTQSALVFITTCPSESQVGRILLKIDSSGSPYLASPTPLFNMVPPPGVAARFGFNFLNTMVFIDARVHQQADGSWSVETGSSKTTEGLGVPGFELEFWGVPASPEHEFERSCPGEEAAPSSAHYCESKAPEESFLRMPTSCTEAGKGMPWSAHVDSWWNPGATLPGGAPDLSDPAWKSLSIESHQPPGYPLPLQPSTFPTGYTGPTAWGAPAGVEECADAPFGPTTNIQPTTPAADSPSGLAFSIHMPQSGLTNAAPGAVAEADLKAVSVKLPEGMSVNPASPNGLAACSAAQIGLKSAPGQSPALFSGGPQSCPDASKVGSVTIESPLVTEPEEPKVLHPLEGSVYLAAQHENPFGSLLALYLVIEDPQSGTILKLPGEVKADPHTGQLETIFEDNPQLPFSTLHVELFSGPRAALRTPPACGTYTAQVALTPWSGNPAVVQNEPIEISSGPGGNCPAGGFEPHLAAGTENPLAGQTSPFHLRLSREDGVPELTGLTDALPPGLSGYLAGIPYCPDSVLASISGEEGTGRAQEANPSCPAASQIGTVTVGAGPGTNPFYTQSGRAYLAGPYKGAPLSIAVVVPAVAGPFDLGTSVVRTALHVDPETARITAVSDPFPTILHGIPLDLRDVRLDLDRPHFTLNPTSCDPLSIDSTVLGEGGASATLSNRFQVAGCEALGFKPMLTLKLKGKTNRGAHPALRAVLTMPEGGANISRTAVTLPDTEILDNAHINGPCTRVQYAEGAGGGAACPRTSVLGYAKAWSPLLDQPLQGPVYLRANGGERKLPDLVASLNGQIHLDLVGYIDSVKGEIRTTFATVPDAPVSKFMLSMQGNRKGLLVNTSGVCTSKSRATALFDAQNGRIWDIEPVVKADCRGKGARKGGKRHR